MGVTAVLKAPVAGRFTAVGANLSFDLNASADLVSGPGIYCAQDIVGYSVLGQGSCSNYADGRIDYCLTNGTTTDACMKLCESVSHCVSFNPNIDGGKCAVFVVGDLDSVGSQHAHCHAGE